jgi:chromate reductase
MKNKKICIILASVGKNLGLANEIVEFLKEKNCEISFLNIVEMNLPLYSSSAESLHSAEQLINPYKEQMIADGFVFVAPEYNGGPPPAFNNFLAWLSRSTKNWRETLNGKSAMLASFSAGSGIQATAIMRMQLSHVGMNVIGRTIQSTTGRAHKIEEVVDTCEALLKTIH